MIAAGGFPPELLMDYVGEIESFLSARTSSQDYFDDRFASMAWNLGDNWGADGPYNTLYDAYQQTVSSENLGAIKQNPLRLAILGQYRTEKTSTFDVLQKSYPRYLLTLRSQGARLADIRRYTDKLDATLNKIDAAVGLPGSGDPLFASKIDQRVKLAHGILSEQGIEFGTASSALTNDFIKCRNARDPLLLAARHAYFGDTHALMVTPSGSGRVHSGNTPGLDCGYDCIEYYPYGTSVTLTAVPGTGAGFQGWGGNCAGTGLTCTIKVTGERLVFANFVGGATTFNLSINKIGDGVVTSDPGEATCGHDCSEDYAAGTDVTLEASPLYPYKFVRWGGACAGTAATCVVKMDTSKLVSAVFNTSTPTYTLGVLRYGLGSVRTVGSSGCYIECGRYCVDTCPSAVSITLEAIPDSGSTFKRWGGACSGTATTCTIAKTAATYVTASFHTPP
jgi:hypothetical protein